MTLLTIVQEASDQLSLPQPTSVISNTDQIVRTMLSMVNLGGRQLAKSKHAGWVVLQRLHSFSTVASQAEYTLPSDFDHFIGETDYDRTNTIGMTGPITPAEWQEIKSGLTVSPALRKRWRVRQGASVIAKRFEIDPTPTAVETVVYEYVSTLWCVDTGGTTGRVGMTVDNDTSLLDEDLHVMDLKWRYQQPKGFNFAVLLKEFEESRDLAISRDGGARILSLTPGRGRRVPVGNVPETGFGT